MSHHLTSWFSLYADRSYANSSQLLFGGVSNSDCILYISEIPKAGSTSYAASKKEQEDVEEPYPLRML